MEALNPALEFAFGILYFPVGLGIYIAIYALIAHCTKKWKEMREKSLSL